MSTYLMKQASKKRLILFMADENYSRLKTEIK